MWNRLCIVVVLLLVSLNGCVRQPIQSPKDVPPLTTQRSEVFILGADISWTQEDEAQGAEYYDKGVKKDVVEILRDHGFNYVRLRVFVDPKSTTGYARRRTEAFNDTAHTVAMAKRVKAAGMGLFLSYHYSDSWADPEHQPKPQAWETLPFPELVDALRQHTRDVLLALRAEGITPEIVGVGNEITHGMLWPDGRVGSAIPSGNAQTDANAAKFAGASNYDQFAVLLNAGISAVREVSPGSRVLIHNHLGRHNLRVREWMDNLISRGVKFDIIGLSCYAQGVEGDWLRNFVDLAARYPEHKLVVVEYSARKRYINDLMFGTPGNQGLGTFIWEPTRHREALFDKNGVNAGGGQASNFVQDFGINQGATSRPASRPSTTRSATTGPRRSTGGRYDTNGLIDLYPDMARDYGIGIVR
ncbi:MAG: glycosyl hydrolase 53 family protein [Burkholderiales bacterium]|nr:glycosyl hydrolase 53 family protein [Phycisphaerae bacterium]